MVTTSTSDMGTTAGRRTVVGVFDGPNHAERALTELKNAGFSPDQVSVVAKDSSESREMVESTGMGAEGTATGAVLGGITGGVLGWLVGIGALLIPGIGPIVAAGALATTLGGAAIGAAAGGLIGALVDMGVPEEHARGYEESIRQGSILLTVHATSNQQAQEARDIFDRYGGSDVRAYGMDEGYDDDQPSGAGTAIGGVSGAATGAVMGAAGGPVGAVIGGVAGAVAGGAVGAAGDQVGEKLDDDSPDTVRRDRGDDVRPL